MTNIELTPAFLIHRRTFQGSSLLLDFIIRDFGKTRLVARSGRKNKTSFQMFQRLNISYKGRGELKYLTHWEINDKPRRFLGNDLVLGLYVNELLSRLLPDNEAHQKLFDEYYSFIDNISDQTKPEKEFSLRMFENLLLEDIGYGLEFKVDALGNKIEPNLCYRFDGYEGLIVSENGKISGKTLHQLDSRFDYKPNSNQLAALKKLNRVRLQTLLDGKPLKSRELFIAN
jgi:DNA repair protein RecO (recombination protein O)|tara:strand:- start:138 stop:824 length:687 start_codon:yes stop_codon:yes gene_type:complete